MLGWVKIYYNDRWWWPRPPHNIGLFCMMVLKVYCVTQKECVWVRRGWDIIIALLKLRLRSQSVFLFLSSWFLFCFSFINCHFFLIFWQIFLSNFLCYHKIFRNSFEVNFAKFLNEQTFLSSRILEIVSWC